jgi:CubicO group peptidase (beta-lactamase class C family)
MAHASGEEEISMRVTALVLGSILVAGCASVQQNLDHAPPAMADPELVRLRQYEGLYEYENGTTLQIAASPADKILFAVISDARYPLKPLSGDTFTNSTNQRVLFTREGGAVAGYTLPDNGSGQVFRRLSSDVHFPVEMWYPRSPDAPVYSYVPPRDLEDGLPVGAIRGPALDRARIEEMVRRIARGEYPDVHSVLILEKSVLVLEEYFYEYNAETVHQLRSATKSFVSALIGIAIDQGLIESVRAPVLPYFTAEYERIENLTESKRKITIEDLLTQRSGLECNDWDPASAGNESRMGQSEDWVKFILDLPMVHEPGTVASYCSGGVVLLGRIVERASGRNIEDFAREHLFGPLGIHQFEWRFEPDRSSSETFVQLSLRPRDMVRFGLLFAQGGRWNGRQILSEEWVEASTARHTAVGDTDYGYLWWRPYLNVAGGQHHGILATGNGGQKIYIWPELDLIVVLTGGNYNEDSPVNKLLINYILPPK